MKFLAKHIWKNGAGVVAKVFKRAPKGKDKSDVILLGIRAEGEKPIFFNMNVIDAQAVIHCLSIASTVAIEQGSPTQPEE